jgi:DNA-binding MarR family transcriptional regulator
VAKSLLQQELQKRKPFECPEQEVTLNLLRTADVVSREAHSLIERHGISGQQYNVLRILRGHRETGLPCQKIVAQMITQTPDITRLVDRLEAGGFVRRERTEQDRRLVIVHITAVGMDLLAQLDEPVLNMHRGQMKHMTRAELAELNRLLEKLRRPVTEAVVSIRKKACST